MNENENMETVENYDQGISVPDVGSDAGIYSGSNDYVTDLGQDASMASGSLPSVSSGDAGTSGSNIYILDSDGNYIPVSSFDSASQAEQMEVQNLSTDDLEPYFTALNYRLDLIIFLLLFYWCARKIKIAVANFTGRSLDNGKDVL